MSAEIWTKYPRRAEILTEVKVVLFISFFNDTKSLGHFNRIETSGTKPEHSGRILNEISRTRWNFKQGESWKFLQKRNGRNKTRSFQLKFESCVVLSHFLMIRKVLAISAEMKSKEQNQNISLEIWTEFLEESKF